MRFCDCAKNSATKDKTLAGMSNNAITFGEWRNIFCRCKAGSSAEKRALWRMMTLAKTFGDWLSVHTESLPYPKFRKFALKRLMALADDPVDMEAKKRDSLKVPRWTEILKISDLDTVEEFIASQKVIHYMVAKKKSEKELGHRDCSIKL